MSLKIKEKLSTLDKSWLDTGNSRFSLRIPQKEALEILAYALEQISEEDSLEDNLKKIQELHESFTGFHFDFPSLCFSIATWVWKTRLMGAMIWWLYKVKKYRNFFVVAPNLTIYEKLVQDFTYGTSKYVFQWIWDFDASNPRIIDGNNYAQVNISDSIQALDFHEFNDEVTINIFNISKFNSSKETAKIKKLSEYLGTSYFDYLRSLKDLVVLMDESHRYKAKNSSKAINELHPILWLEFTATPYYQKSWANGKIFENIVYEYNLANAIQDWYVKVPAVATRKNFDNSLSDEDKDFLKLQDGIYIHENTKIDLEIYAQNRWVKPVKPFILISAIDQNHAQKLEDIIKSNRFFEWHYKDKVIKVISGWKADERDEAIKMLLSVESSENPVEIVIQVMMLKEWWDVNNLYTIVPLRASASETLTEQTLWRGLRLPYWKRTWDEAVDRLTIVAHGEYEKIVAIANDPESLVHNVISLDDRTGFWKPRQLIMNSNSFDDAEWVLGANIILQEKITQWEIEQEEAIEITQELTSIIHEVVSQEENKVHTSADLKNVETKKNIENKIFERVRNISTSKPKYSHTIKKIGMENLVSSAQQASIFFIDTMIEKSIDIPEIIYDYGNTTVEFNTDFVLDTEFIKNIPDWHDSEIVIKDLITNDVTYFERPQIIDYSWTLEDFCVDIIISISEIDYWRDEEFIYQNAKLISEAFRERFPRESEETLLAWVSWLRQYLLKHINTQIRSPEVMKISYSEPTIEIIRWFRTIKNSDFDAFIDGWLLSFKDTNFEKKNIRSIVFKWFKKSVAKYVKFDSDSERIYSVIIEEDIEVLKWMKPPIWVFKLFYRHNNITSEYLPDFIIETKDYKYLIEVKAENDLEDDIVQSKAEAAKKWCRDVNSLIDWKEWRYIMIPHTMITIDKSFKMLCL